MVWIVFLLLVIAIVIAITWWLTYRVLFCPSRKLIWTPDVEYQDLYLKIDDDSGTYYPASHRPKEPCINMWYMNNYPGKNVVLYFHGNSGNISHRDYIVDIARKFELNLLLIDYRGYGRSDGTPTAKGICRDSICAYEFLRKKHPPEKIIVWGESLGGCAAIHVAAHRPCKCLLLLSTFASLDDAIHHMNAPKWVSRPIGYAVKSIVDPIPSKEWISKVKCPVAIMHSHEDELISHINGKILYDHVSHNNKLFISIDGKHACPDIKEGQLTDLFNFAEIDICVTDQKTICEILKALKTIADRPGIM
jgi:uncharacterized protein